MVLLFEKGEFIFTRLVLNVVMAWFLMIFLSPTVALAQQQQQFQQGQGPGLE